MIAPFRIAIARVLSGNMDTDKKHSSINMLVTRGRRVVAEAVIRKDILRDLICPKTKPLAPHPANVGSESYPQESTRL